MDLGSGIRNALRKLQGKTVVDFAAVKELIKELQRVLLANDVNVKLVFDLSKQIEKNALDENQLKGLSLREHVVKVVYDSIVSVLGADYSPRIDKHKIMLVGLFGQGKTTTISKLIKFYQSKGLKVAAIAGDVHRPAAIDQLEQLCKAANAGFYSQRNADAQTVVKNGLEKLTGFDVIVLDTAGRSAFDEELASELSSMNELFSPQEVFLVVSADLGQVAGKQAKQFSLVAPITGVIVTKMDGSGKGGGALSAVAASNSKIAFIGVGEKPGDFEVFDSKKFVARLCGFADLPTLLEKVKEISDEENLEKAMEDGKLDYNSFLSQMRAMKKMGPLKSIVQMLGIYDIPQDALDKSGDKLKSFEAAVNSMTRQERVEPELMKNKSRQLRVAAGAGLKPDEVKELVGNFEKVTKMFKAMKNNRGMMKNLGKMMGNFKGGMPALR
ncbi:signal recognition particle protein [Candidatus Micrarchaeota archaeon]|nr:signal recognition particle protein [Candidatus Micrarchaeota archaeon]